MPLESRDAKNKCIGVWNSERFGEIKCTRQKAGGKREVGVWTCAHGHACIYVHMYVCTGTCVRMCVFQHLCTHMCECLPVSTKLEWEKVNRIQRWQKWLNSTNDLDICDHRFSNCKEGR